MAQPMTPPPPPPPAIPYPVRLNVELAERQSRWQALFRVILAVPAVLLSWLLLYPLYLSVFVMWVSVLIRGRPPSWMFAFVLGIARVYTRVFAYFFLMTDKYVVFEGDHPLQLDIDFPQRVSRWQLVFWKLIMTAPHAVVVSILHAAALAVAFIAWIAIIFGGSYPKGLHNFTTGVLRWQARVTAYFFSLTDAYPPYNLDANAGPASRRSYVISAALGLLLTAAYGGLIAVAVIVAGGNRQTFAVDYDRLIDGRQVAGENEVFGEGLRISLEGGDDPAQPFGELVEPDQGERFLSFEFTIENFSDDDLRISRYDFGLVDGSGNDNSPVFVFVNGRRAPEEIRDGESATIQAVFEIGEPGPPRELSYRATGTLLKTLVYQFR